MPVSPSDDAACPGILLFTSHSNCAVTLVEIAFRLKPAAARAAAAGGRRRWRRRRCKGAKAGVRAMHARG